MEWYLLAAVIGVGFIAGFINTLAGSGSLLTLPLLMFLGLPANVANGTNRIAILLQNIVGVASFTQQKVLSYKEGLKTGIPAVAGSLIGAVIAVKLDDELMGRIIGGLLLFMFFMVMIRPEKWIGQQEKRSTMTRWGSAVLFFLIGIYGGFIQAGVGFFLLGGLVLGAGYDLVRANAVKVFIILLYTPVALTVFVLHGQVDYRAGLILAAGNMLGAFTGARFAVRWGPRVIRYFLLAALAFASLKLAGLFELIGRVLQDTTGL